mmetsp:Transcript_29637/g.57294  ORF Transcript_29637/g.57294 Transcript_29637/m.57294 type:complete len:615 (+) Transcript_29637:2-1846(+)
MESPRTTASTWLAMKRQDDPASYRNVVYDAHLYHAYQDDDKPGRSWDRYVDSCKTCCRDPVLLEPLVERGLPMAIGEYSLNTGFAGTPSFYAEYLRNQLSLFASMPGMVGSFFWNHRVLRTNSWFKEMSLLELIQPNGNLPPVSEMNLTVRCAGMNLSMCPSFDPTEALWSDKCEWPGNPEILELACPGSIHVKGYGPVSMVPSGWGSTVTSLMKAPIEVLDGSVVVPHLDSRGYFAHTCKAGTYANEEYLSLKLLGGTLRYSVDLSDVGCGCNAAVALTQMVHNDRPTQCNDYYCDASNVCGETCVEIDLQEANRHAWRSTLHSADDRNGLGKGYGGGGWGWNGPRDWDPSQYGPDGRCIDTREAFEVAVHFPVDSEGNLTAMEVTLLQHQCKLELKFDRYVDLPTVSDALRKGMTPVVTYWGSEELSWLDGQGADSRGPCTSEEPASCSKVVVFRGFSVEGVPVPNFTQVRRNEVKASKPSSTRSPLARQEPLHGDFIHLSKNEQVPKQAGRTGGGREGLAAAPDGRWVLGRIFYLLAGLGSCSLAGWLIATVVLGVCRQPMLPRDSQVPEEMRVGAALQRSRPSAQGLLQLAEADGKGSQRFMTNLCKSEV